MASPVKTASFSGLPIELRCQIMEYLLPRWERHERSLRQLPVTQMHQRDQDHKREEVAICPPSMAPSWNGTEFLLLNHQIHTEAMGIFTLHSSIPHQLNISEESYWCNGPEEMAKASTNKTKWNVKQLFPTSDLRKVQELIINIKPTDFPGF